MVQRALAPVISRRLRNHTERFIKHGVALFLIGEAAIDANERIYTGRRFGPEARLTESLGAAADERQRLENCIRIRCDALMDHLARSHQCDALDRSLTNARPLQNAIEVRYESRVTCTSFELRLHPRGRSR